VHWQNARARLVKRLLGLLLALLFSSGRSGADDAAKFIVVQPGAIARHAMGLERADPATYRALPEVPQFRAFYPPAWDLSPMLPPPGDQGRQGSCTAWAVGYAARSYYLKRDFAADVSQAENILSPAFIYNSLRVPPGNCAGGTSIAKALDLLQAAGGVPLNALPYDPADCSALPSAETLSEFSSRFRIKGYRRVEGSNEDDVKGLLYSGNPVIFAIDIPPEFDTYGLGSGVIDDITDRGPSFGHAMVLVGYDDTRQAYRFVNSWGLSWGDHGFGWLSYRTADKLWLEGYVMQVVRPPPAPPAPPATLPPAPAAQAPQIDASAPCAKLAVELAAQAAGYTVKLSGFAGSADDLERVRQAALIRPGVAQVDVSAVILRPWPQCEAFLTLDAALQSPHGLSIARTPDRARLVKGEHFVFEVQSPDYPSYLYVAYIQADGTAAHLLRPSGTSPTPPNTRIRLGDTPGQPRYRVGAPYGHEMVVVLSSVHPLLDEAMLGPVRERQLLTAYRKALLAANAGDVAAAITTLETAEQ
jgi:hypothetical protein